MRKLKPIVPLKSKTAISGRELTQAQKKALKTLRKRK